MTMKKMIKSFNYKLLVSLVFIFVLTIINNQYAQKNDSTDEIKEKPEKRFKVFREYLYSIDEVDEAPKKDDTRFFLATYKSKEDESKKRIDTISFFKKVEDKKKGLDAEAKVNRDGISYYFIKYEDFDKDNKYKKKTLFDKNGKDIANYQYTWDKDGNLTKLERFGRSAFLNEPVLENTIEYEWKGKSLQSMTVKDKGGITIEKYNFKQGVNLGTGPKKKRICVYTQELENDPKKAEKYEKYTIGNYKINITLLKNFIRYQQGSKDIDFYIIYDKPKGDIKGELSIKKYFKDGQFVDETIIEKIDDEIKK